MKVQIKRFLGILLLAGAALAVGCDNGSTDTTVTADISVPAITAVANPMQFGPVSDYTGWDDNFPHTDVTYTLSIDGGDPLPAGTTTVDADGLSNGTHTITQTFYYNGKAIDSRNGTLGVVSNAFAGITQNFPALTLSLSKKL